METAAEWTCLGVLAGVAFLVCVKSLRFRSRILHLPSLVALAFLGFLGPQAIGVIRSGSAPWYAVCKFLLFSALCSAAVYWGWAHGPTRPARLADPRLYRAELRLFFGIGLGLEVVGLLGQWRLAGLVGGFRNLYLGAAGYGLEWRGEPVFYGFFADYLVPGGLLVALAGLRLRSSWRLAFALPALALQMATVLLAARRTPLVLLLLTVGCLLYWTRGWLPPRRVAIAMALGVAAAMFALPRFRTAGGVFSGLPVRETAAAALGETLVAGGEEFRDGCFLMQVTDEEHAFQYGLGFYNAWVRYFVPRAVVGDEGKENLLINLPDAGHVGPTASAVFNRYDWRIAPYVGPTGPASCFQQFWYFGWVCFYVLARWLNGHWLRAAKGDPLSQVTYAVCVTSVTNSVINDIYAFYSPLFSFAIPLKLVCAACVLPAHGSRRTGRSLRMSFHSGGQRARPTLWP